MQPRPPFPYLASGELLSTIQQGAGEVVSRQLLRHAAEYLADPYSDTNPKGVKWRDCWAGVLGEVGRESLARTAYSVVNW